MSRIQTIALVMTALAVPLLAGCMSDSPRTVFDWGVNDKPPRPAAAKQRANTYVYQDKNAQTAPRPTNTVARNAPVTSQALPPPVGGVPAFDWPVSGRVISDFGATANGGKNDGINLAANQDAPIHASASGTVTYAGDELKNYGNLVLVKHSGGYTTAYAHAGRLTVARGDFVTRGQIIGYVGQTGRATSPHVHYEILLNGSPVSPMPYLTGQR